jgi:methenyltetrahydrofolate cyclohydrolase
LASAFAGYLAAELILLVTRLSTGRNLGLTDQRYAEMNAEAKLISEKLLSGAFEDIRAFSVIDAAYKLPQNTEDEKTARRKAIEDGGVCASELPMENAFNCKKILGLAKELENKSNVNCSSDLECALSLAKFGIKGCVLNIRANLPIIKSEDKKARFISAIAELEADN